MSTSASGSQQSHTTSRVGRSNQTSGVGRRAHRLDADRPENQVRVLDTETKEDRTPKPFLRDQDKKPKPAAKRPSQTVEGGAVSPASTSQVSEERSQSRLESTESGSTTPQSVSQSMSEGDTDMMEPLVLDESMDSSSLDSRQTSEQDRRRDRRQDDDEHAEPQNVDERVVIKREMTFEERRAWLQSPVTISLTETPTIFLLERPDEQIAIDSEEAKEVTTRNEVYNKICSQREATKFLERGVQTFNNPCKNKDTQFTSATTHRACVGVTTWEIYETMRRLGDEEQDGEAQELKPTHVEPSDDVTTDVEDDTALDDDAGDFSVGGEGGAGRSRRNVWMNSPSLSYTLMIVERMVVQNVWQDEQLLYRNVEPAQFEERAGAGTGGGGGGARTDTSKIPKQQQYGDKEASVSPTCRILWRFRDQVTNGRVAQNATSLAWNHKNTDILAIGYGDYGTAQSGVQQKGKVCCWSLKNPVAPERTITIDTAGVSSVDWSHHHPSLLAVGHTDGALALYDIRKQSNSPALKSTVGTERREGGQSVGGQHTGTIWEVKWVMKGKDRGDSLITISADGRVTDWSIKKGLESSNLIRLKRVPNKQQGVHEIKGDTLLSRQSGGMCIDFNPNESERMIYIVGTEDGTVHKCSTSYQEQYLMDYAGHAGPVYRCRWSPYCPSLASSIFLTCSSDWTTKLWNYNKVEPLFTFQSVPDAVHDVAWSPNISTVFGTVTSKGRLDVWDLKNPLEPATYLELEGRCLNCLAFAETESTVMVTGDSLGDATVIKLSGEYSRGADDLQKSLNVAHNIAQ